MIRQLHFVSHNVCQLHTLIGSLDLLDLSYQLQQPHVGVMRLACPPPIDPTLWEIYDFKINSRRLL